MRHPLVSSLLSLEINVLAAPHRRERLALFALFLVVIHLARDLSGLIAALITEGFTRRRDGDSPSFLNYSELTESPLKEPRQEVLDLLAPISHEFSEFSEFSEFYSRSNLINLINNVWALGRGSSVFRRSEFHRVSVPFLALRHVYRYST